MCGVSGPRGSASQGSVRHGATTRATSDWVGELRPFDFKFATSVASSDVTTARLSGTWVYEFSIPEAGETYTLDMIVEIVGTAHAVPGGSLTGLAALGGIGGLWVYRRRSRRPH